MDRELLEKRPAIFVVGSPNVGKRTLLSRLLKIDFDDASDTFSELSVHGWTIDTKYYTADVAVWTAHLSDGLSISSFPSVDRLVALVMVFDTSDLSSLGALKEWVLRTEIQKFDILLCIGNKVDLLPDHPAHVEYKRHLLKVGESSANTHTEFSEYGLSETEGSSLLGNEEPSMEFKNSCIEWCLEHNIEYVEACASNADFDQCLSRDGDSQGMDRVYGALSAHMWPGMSLKSGDKIDESSLPDQEESSEEESDYEPEYEKLSSASAEPWDDVEWKSAEAPVSTSGSGTQQEKVLDTSVREGEGETITGEESQTITGEESQPSTSELDREESRIAYEAEPASEENDSDKTYDFEDLETLMAEIGNVRNGLRLLPDFQRREMAAKLAMKMATMFGDSSGGEEELLD